MAGPRDYELPWPDESDGDEFAGAEDLDEELRILLAQQKPSARARVRGAVRAALILGVVAGTLVMAKVLLPSVTARTAQVLALLALAGLFLGTLWHVSRSSGHVERDDDGATV